MTGKRHRVNDDSVDWADIADLICSILIKIRQNASVFEQAALTRGITIEQLTAAAITEAIREHIE